MNKANSILSSFIIFIGGVLCVNNYKDLFSAIEVISTVFTLDSLTLTKIQ